MAEKTPKRPLEGIRVLNLSWALFGPYCGMILTDLGAEVIKIERPVLGDQSRQWGPFFPNVQPPNNSGYYVSLHRGQKGITLNLKHPKGKEIFLKLVKISDVIVANFRPGTLEEWGLGYDVLKEVNPRIIVALGSGFGQERYHPFVSPWASYPSYDIVGQAFGGFMELNGWPDKPPCRAGSSIGDIIAGLFLTIGILAALRWREITGKGQLIDVAQADSILAAMENAYIRYSISNEVPTRIGAKHPTIAPFDVFKAKDGWVVIGVGNDAIWRRFCQAIGKPELIDDPRFKTNPDRCDHYDELKPIIEEWTSQRNKRDIWQTLVKYDIPSAPVYTMKDIDEDPHFEKRQMIVEIDQPPYGKVKIVGCPIKFSETPITTEFFGPAPLLGQHTEEVLQQLLGMSKEEIEQLRKEGVI